MNRWLIGALMVGYMPYACALSSAERWDEYELLSQEGYSEAYVELANCYRLGDGREKDMQKAVELLQKSVDAGSLRGMSNLASLHIFRYIDQYDYEYAVSLLRTAADGGRANAMFVLGIAYNNGLGVDRDRKKAIEYIRNAADSGHTMSIFVMYASTQLGLFGYAPDDGLANDWKERLAAGLEYDKVHDPDAYIREVIDEDLVRDYIFSDTEIEKIEDHYD